MKLGKKHHSKSFCKTLKNKYSLPVLCISLLFCFPAASQDAESIKKTYEYDLRDFEVDPIFSENDSFGKFDIKKFNDITREDPEKLINEKLNKIQMRSNIVISALGFIGIPYKWGGSNSETGFDCSGFVKSIYENSLGFLLPRKADQQAKATHEISKGNMIPGDLVFFNTMRKSFSHVGIYLGQGRFIHAPRAGALVRVDDIENSYWSSRFDGARRVVMQ